MSKNIPERIYFTIDHESKQVGFYFDLAPKDIAERKMQKVFDVKLNAYESHGEMDVEDFFISLDNSRIKCDTFVQLFKDHGKYFLPRFQKWESITS